MDKSELRHIIRERKRQYSSQQLEMLSLPIIERLNQHPKVRNAGTILLYYSLPDEVNTHSLIKELYKENKTILLPKVVDEGKLEIRVYTGETSMVMGAFQIMEPTGPLFTEYNTIDLAIIPGMSFDKRGNRLGRGKGYYDRFLAHVPSLYKIGLCFDFQKTEKVPAELTDIAMDEVL
ncbi:MAG: 5-formyltetrahydrofolate cyclo-ligase [Prevotella sp.]|jgi:5-formyltetrahydrofolate cyclo-ligase